MNVGTSKIYVTIKPIFNSISAFVPAQADSFMTLPVFTTQKKRASTSREVEHFNNTRLPL